MNDDELIKSVKEFVSIDDINKLCSLGYNKSVIRIYDGLGVIQNEQLMNDDLQLKLVNELSKKKLHQEELILKLSKVAGNIKIGYKVEYEVMEIHNLSRSILELQIRIDILIDIISKIK